MQTATIEKAFATEIESPTAQYILLKLASLADDEGAVAIGIASGASFCKVHPQTFKTHIRTLQESGYLRVVEGTTPFAPSSFRLTL